MKTKVAKWFCFQTTKPKDVLTGFSAAFYRKIFLALLLQKRKKKKKKRKKLSSLVIKHPFIQ